MNEQRIDETALHLVWMVVITLLISLVTIYPFLPGDFDVLAAPLSTTVQLFTAAGLLLVPIGVVWLVYEIRRRAQMKRDRSTSGRGYHFAIASLVIASILAIAVSLLVMKGISMALGGWHLLGGFTL